MNLSGFLVLGLALVYGIICGFLIGYDKFDGERSVDWSAVAGFTSAIATFFGGGAVVWVYQQWKNQKGSEVIANEAKDVLIDIKELKAIFLQLIGYRYKYESEEAVAINISKLTTLSTSTIKKLMFISESIEDLDKINTISQSIALLQSVYKQIGKIIFSDEEGALELMLTLLEGLEKNDETKNALSALDALDEVIKKISIYKFKIKR